MPNTFSSISLDPFLQIKSPIMDLKRGFFLPPLSVGEVVEADVLGKFGHRKLLILLKMAKILADSEVPFRQGEKITVKVEQLHPNVVLRLMQNQHKSEDRLIADYMKFYRSNPKALYDLFMELRKVFNPDDMGKAIPFLEKKNIQSMGNILEALMISKKNLDDRFFLKNYIYKSGYLIEKELKKTVNNSLVKTTNLKDSSQTLKGLLIEISDKLNLLTKTGHLPGAERLSKIVNSSLKTIESHQVINYLFQEHEGKYIFQIPILFPNDMGLAEIFIRPGDKKLDKRDPKRQKSALFLLNMDALGDIVVEIKIIEKNISCILKCEREDLYNFMLPLLDGLRESLNGLGYKVDYVKCVVEKDLLKRNEYHEFQNLFAQEKVDFLV
ncbi:MAG: hypothetical protein GWP10_16445 [Nitrospiraceae bacterium]|nr:hypothetical protein [Nitrospiraceae bacterium]